MEKKMMNPIQTTASAVRCVRSSLKGALLTLLLIAAGIACSSTSAPADTPTSAPADTPTSAPVDTPTSVPPEPLRLGMLDIGRMDDLIHGDREGEVAHRTDGPIVRSVMLAIKHVNDAGGVFGVPVEVRSANTDDGLTYYGADPAAAAARAARFVDEDGVHAVIGPFYSPDSLEIASAVAAPRQIPFITPISNSPMLAEADDDGFLFRTTMSDIAQADALAQLAEDEGYTRVAVIYRNDYWGQHVDQAFEDHFDGETISVPIEDNQESYHDEAEAAEAHEPEAVVLATSVPDSETLIADIIETGHFDETYLLMAHYKRLTFIEQHPELDGTKGVAIYGRHITEAEGHWEADYAAEYGELPHGPYTREAYDAAMALMLAAEYAGSTDGAAIRDALPIIAGPPGIRFPASSDGVKGALEAIRNGQDIDLDGEATTIDWDENGDVTIGGVEIWQFQDGGIVSLRHFEIDVTK